MEISRQVHILIHDQETGEGRENQALLSVGSAAEGEGGEDTMAVEGLVVVGVDEGEDPVTLRLTIAYRQKSKCRPYPALPQRQLRRLLCRSLRPACLLRHPKLKLPPNALHA
jgi:hypothetical protein